MDDDVDAPTLDELDLAIVHALQIDARVPWTRLAGVLGIDAATVARHWRLLSERRAAWLTSWPTPQRWASSSDLAVIVLDTPPGTDAAEVRGAVLDLPWAIGLDDTSAGLVVTVAASRGLDALAERRRQLIALGTRVRRMDVVAALAEEDSTWRLQALSRDQQRALARPTGVPSRPPASHLVDDIAAALDEDPRLPTVTLAARLGVSEPTARRAVDRVLAAGLVRVGCDLAMAGAGLGRGAILWARAFDVEAAAARAARLPEAHRVGVTVGPAPLFVCVRARSLAVLPRIERAWQDATPVEVVDRWTVLRTWKRNGHLLDAAGRTLRRVPVAW